MQRHAGISHDEIRSLLGAYALDAVDRYEADVVDSHLRVCACCCAEANDHRQVVSTLWLRLATDK